MNLDDFKTLWQASVAEKMTQQHVDVQEIRRLVQQKTDNALAKVSRNLLMDAAFLIVFLCLGVVAMFTTDEALIDWIVVISAVIFIPFLVFFFQQYFFLKKVPTQGKNLRALLESVILSLKKYVKRYFQAVMILTLASVPIIVAISFYNSNTPSQNPIVELAATNPQLYAVFYSIFLLSILVGNYFFTKWYLKKLYGNYIEDLQSYLDELDEVVQRN